MSDMVVLGQKVDSKEEYFVSLALNQLKLQYAYQVPIAGGHALRGGQVIDFLLYTAPMPTPVAIEGSYWHSRNPADDRFKEQQLKELTHGSWGDLVRIKAEDCESVAAAVAALKKALRIG